MCGLQRTKHNQNQSELSTVIQSTTVVSRNEEPVAVDVDGTVVMMSVDQGMYFALEGVGSRIWALLEQPRSVSEVCETLTEEFEIDAEACRREVVGFLDELHGAQLIRIHDRDDGTNPTPERA